MVSQHFLRSFQHIHIASVSGHCTHLIIKIWQIVAVTSVIRQFHRILNIIYGTLAYSHSFRFRPLYALGIQNLSNRSSNKRDPSISRKFVYHFWRVFCFLAQLASVSLVSSLKENGLKRWECSQCSEPREAVLHTVSMYVSLYTVYLCALSWVYIPLRPFILFPYILSFLEERVHTLLYQLSWEWLHKVFKGWPQRCYLVHKMTINSI